MSILAVILILVSCGDLLNRRVPNAVLYVLLTYLCFMFKSVSIQNVALLVVFFFLSVVFHKRGFFGGGDIKLLLIFILFIDIKLIPLFILATCLVGGLVAFACYVDSKCRKHGDIQSIPYAIPICFVGFFGVLASM